MKKLALLLLLAGTSLLAQTPYTYEVTITNITRGQIFSPPIAIAHSRGYSMFKLGVPASEALAAMAEDGMNGTLADEAAASDSVYGVATAEGPVMPGHSVTLTLEIPPSRPMFTVAGMLVSTNDGFFAVNGHMPGGVSFKNGGSTNFGALLAEAYDAGSEANNEDCGSIPGPPCGNPGNRVEDGAEGYVSIHAGLSGAGDLDVGTYDWRSKVAAVTIKLVR